MSDRWRHIWIFTSAESSKMDSCRRRCLAKLYAIARFSKWLQQGGIRLEDIDEIRMRRFLDRDPGVVHYPEPATIRRLVVILREMGVLKPESPPALTSVQRCVADYRRYLVHQRGLSESCLPNYISFVEQFLAERFGENEPCFVGLCASDVTTFVKSRRESCLLDARSFWSPRSVPSCVTCCIKDRSQWICLFACRQWPVGLFLRYPSLCRQAPSNEFFGSKIGPRRLVVGTSRF